MISKDEVEKSCDYYEDLKILEKKTFYHADDVMSCDDDEQFFSIPNKKRYPLFSHTLKLPPINLSFFPLFLKHRNY